MVDTVDPKPLDSFEICWVGGVEREVVRERDGGDYRVVTPRPHRAAGGAERRGDPTEGSRCPVVEGERIEVGLRLLQRSLTRDAFGVVARDQRADGQSRTALVSSSPSRTSVTRRRGDSPQPKPLCSRGAPSWRALEVPPHLPDTPCVREALALAQASCSPWVMEHAYRTPFWAHLLGAGEGRAFARERGWSEERRGALGDAIALHMNPQVPTASRPEAHLLQAGAALDVLGARLGELDRRVVAAVPSRHPRGAFGAWFAEVMRVEARRTPGPRTSLLVALGFTGRIERSLWRDVGGCWAGEAIPWSKGKQNASTRAAGESKSEP